MLTSWDRAHMCQNAAPSFVRIMTCHLIDTTPLSDAMLAYCSLDHWEQKSVESKWNTIFFSLRLLWKCCLQYGGCLSRPKCNNRNANIYIASWNDSTPDYNAVALKHVQYSRYITSTGRPRKLTKFTILQCTSPISHNAPFVTEMCTCAHFCYKTLHCEIFVQCLVEFVRWIYYRAVCDIVLCQTAL